jgi:hypothetical protein
VLWSPDGTSMQGAIQTRFPDRKSLFGNDHVYYEGTRWLDSTHLVIHVWGYGDIDTAGFNMWVIYNLNRGWRDIKELRK